MNTLDTYSICGTHMEFFYLTNVSKINHQDMTICGYNVIFYDVAILKWYIF